MNFKKLLSEAIDNDTKIIITGRSGWGKSEMINQVAQEKGMELIDFRLSEVLPEDLVGIPKVKDDFYEYIPPRWLYEVVQHPEKKYLLFLDEITQGTPEVLNICYKIFDKVTKVGNYELTNVAVVGATNYQSESDYLSELPQPLKNRACMLELDHNVKNATNYLVNKYAIKDDTFKQSISSAITFSNPRAVEKALNLVKADVSKELIIPYIGLQFYTEFKSFISFADTPEGVTGLEQARVAIKNGFIQFNKARYKITSVEDLTYMFNLTDEETSIASRELKENERDSAVPGAINGFLSAWATKQDITSDELKLLASCPSFNVLNYLKNMRLTTPMYLVNVQDALCELLHTDIKGLLREICTQRTLSIKVMKHYRKDLPWDLLKEDYKKGWLTQDKIAEFRKELF